MGFVRALKDSVSSTFADQWKEIITADTFEERVVVSPGILKSTINGRGANVRGQDGVVSDGSIIFVPENTAAFIFSQSGIEEIITSSGGYRYEGGEKSIFNKGGLVQSVFKTIGRRVTFGGVSEKETRIAFVNLRELRGVRFGTTGPLMYHDKHYGVDLEIYAHGTYSVYVTDASRFVQNYLEPNTLFCTFDDYQTRDQLNAELIQSLASSVNRLSGEVRVSNLHQYLERIADEIVSDKEHVGSWGNRFGLKVGRVAIENIELSDESRAVIQKYSERKVQVSAFDGTSQKASDIAAKQNISEGILEHGLGEGVPGMILGMNLAQGLNPVTNAASVMTVDDQIESIRKWKELLDEGAITQEEFEIKKKEIMSL